MTRLIIVAVLMAHLTETASAGQFRVGDLGEMPSRQSCMTVAAKVLAGYLDEYGGASVTADTGNPESWEVYGWHLRPGDNDIVITCPVVSGQVNAFLTLYTASADGTEHADIVIERVRELWGRNY
jgi:hypothetical protein